MHARVVHVLMVDDAIVDLVGQYSRTSTHTTYHPHTHFRSLSLLLEPTYTYTYTHTRTLFIFLSLANQDPLLDLFEPNPPMPVPSLLAAIVFAKTHVMTW